MSRVSAADARPAALGQQAAVQERGDLVRGQRMAEVEALGQPAIPLDQEPQLRLVLDALGDDVAAAGLRER
jgi:hypothetical protein